MEDSIKKQIFDFFEICREKQIIKDVVPEILMTIIVGAFNGLEKAFMNGDIEPATKNEAIAEELCWKAIRR